MMYTREHRRAVSDVHNSTRGTDTTPRAGPTTTPRAGPTTTPRAGPTNEQASFLSSHLTTFLQKINGDVDY